MSRKLIAATALAAVLLGAVNRPAPLIVYSAPAGDRPAGADAVHPTTAILPNGRIASPAGQTVFVGSNPLGMTLSPNGRFAIVSNDDEHVGALAPPRTDVPPLSGYSLAVVDTVTMKLRSTYRDASAAFFFGIVAVRDARNPANTLVLASDGVHGVVRVFDLGADGTLVPEDRAIALPPGGATGRFPPALRFHRTAASPTLRIIARIRFSRSTWRRGMATFSCAVGVPDPARSLVAPYPGGPHRCHALV